MTSSDDGPHTRTLLPEDEQQGLGAARPRPSRPLRSLLVVLGAVALLVTAIAVVNRSGDRAPARADSADSKGGGSDPTAASGVPPVRTEDGVPKGFARTEQGAQSAAANFTVALGSAAMFDKDRRHTIVDALYTPETAGPLKARQDKAYTAGLLRRVGLDADGQAPDGMTFISRTVPVGTKIVKYEDGSATVSVWCTGLIGTAGTGSTNPVRTDWMTHTFELRWTGGDWKVAKDSQKQGPAPVEGDAPASGAEEIAGAVDEYGGFTYAR